MIKGLFVSFSLMAVQSLFGIGFHGLLPFMVVFYATFFLLLVAVDLEFEWYHYWFLIFCFFGFAFYASSQGGYTIVGNPPNEILLDTNYTASSFLFWGIMGLGIGLALMPLPLVAIFVLDKLTPRKRYIETTSAQQERYERSYSDWEDEERYRNDYFDFRRSQNSRRAQTEKQPKYNRNLKKLPHAKRRPEDAKYWAIYEDSAASEAEKQFAWRRITRRGR